MQSSGNLVYKRGRGDGRWFEWIKQDEGKGKGERKDSIDLLNKRSGKCQGGKSAAKSVATHFNGLRDHIDYQSRKRDHHATAIGAIDPAPRASEATTTESAPIMRRLATAKLK